MIQYQILDSIKYDIYPDCAQFCPYSNYENLLLIGLYQLENKDSQQVKGGFALFKTNNQKLEQICSLTNMAGVLDLKWFKKFDDILYFILACADGSVQLYSYDQNTIQKLSSYQSGNKCLYVDVCQNYIVVGLDDGRIVVLCINNNDIQQLISYDTIMAFSAWSCAFQQSFQEKNESVFLSGGDDCKLFLHDMRSQMPIQQNSKVHSMGITHIQFCPQDGNIFCTGSFDQNLRIFDIRNIKNEISSSFFEGCIWRTLWNPNQLNQIMVAVYSQHSYQNIEYDSQTYSIIQNNWFYKNHNSLAYGVDWKRGSKSILASISFYDNQIDMWEIK